MNLRKVIVHGLAALGVCVASEGLGAGVTVITHGLNGNADVWVREMANQITNYSTFPGNSYTLYNLHYYNSGGSWIPTMIRLAGSQPSTTDSGEIIVALDWGPLADGFSFDTYQVAGSVASVLQNSNFIADLGGHALCELPLHLIGHSRGGSLMCEVSRRLGTNGVWVDHLTTLDPHPLNNDGFTDFIYSAVDAPCRTYENVVFHDNYWQDDASLIYGEAVGGAYVRKLVSLCGGYGGCTGAAGAYHANVHLWYHATVDERYPAFDGEASVTGSEFSSWYVSYENFGINAGFIYSLIGRGDRTSTDRPVGLGYAAVRDGYNQTYDLGIGQSNPNRTFLPSNGGGWPSVIKFNLVGTNQVRQGTNISVKCFYQWARPNTSTATLSFYLDDDFNPYNGNSHLLQQISVPGNTSDYVNYQNVSPGLNVTNAPLGYHALYTTIAGGGKTRYLYAPEILTVLPPLDTTPPWVAITNPASAKTYTNAQPVTISANATDDVAVASVAFYANGILQGTDTSAPYTHDWLFTAANNGTHSWTARAYDGSGNTWTSAAVALTVSIEITAPIVAMSSPTNGQIFTTNVMAASGTASDSVAPSSGLAVVEVRVNGGSWTNATGTTNWTRTGLTLTNCGNTIEVRSRDKVGNYSALVSNSVFYLPPNTVPNTPIGLSPLNGAINVGVPPTLQASPFSDPAPVCVGDVHAASQWQVLTTNAVPLVVVDSGTDTVNKVSWLVPANKLYYGSNYQWQVRYRDSRNAWSSYSTKSTFRTGGPLLTGTKQGTNIVFKWPTNALGFSLQWSTNLASANWSNATPAAVIVSGQYTVTNGFTKQFQFYRLKK